LDYALIAIAALVAVLLLEVAIVAPLVFRSWLKDRHLMRLDAMGLTNPRTREQWLASQEMEDDDA